MPHLLNVAPILFDSSTVAAERHPYTDELFLSLLARGKGSHVIRRSGNSILAVAVRPEAPSLDGDPVQVALQDDLSLVRALAREALFRKLLWKDCWISNLKPITYLLQRNNLLEECMPSGITLQKGLGVYAKYELELVIINPLGTGPLLGLTINIGTAPRIAITCHALMTQGVPIVGYYVGEPHYGRNLELKPHFQTIGRVNRLRDDGMLELDDVREGQSAVVDPIDVYLEPREDLLYWCIRQLFPRDAETIINNLEAKLTNFNLGNKKFEKLLNALQGYQKLELKLTDKCPFRIGGFLSDEPNGQWPLKIDASEKPLFVFSPSGMQNGTSNDFSLQRYGPYSREMFTPARPRICVICQLHKKGQVEQVLQKFLNGISPVEYGKGRFFTFTGLKTKFYLQDCTLEFFTTADDSVDSYNKAISDALQNTRAGANWNLAIIQIDRNFEVRPPDRNPYLAAKGRFLGQNIPVQEFTLEALGLPDAKVVWTLNNMALASYAKMGGTPWILTADKPIAHEVVFGIGSAMVYSSRLGVKERMIGITTVFMGDGKYFINNVSTAVPADDYFETLLSNLRETMTRVKQDFNWQARDSVRLIFHAFKTFKDKEAEAVKIVMSELGDFQVEYAFVHVAPNHPYLLFDTSQAGGGYYKKGIYAPERTKFAQLSEHVALVTLTGPAELKQTSDGHPRPVQLILHRDSTFKDLRYLSIQVIKFGAHSWRSFQPAPMPVTVYYSQLVAQLLSQLAGVPSWNSDSLYGKIGSTRWFL